MTIQRMTTPTVTLHNRDGNRDSHKILFKTDPMEVKFPLQVQSTCWVHNYSSASREPQHKQHQEQANCSAACRPLQAEKPHAAIKQLNLVQKLDIQFIDFISAIVSLDSRDFSCIDDDDDDGGGVASIYS